MTASGGDSAISTDFENPPEPFEHEPVMLRETLETFQTLESGLFLDATIGGGGHAEAILADAPRRELVGVDRDKSAVEVARSRLKRFGDRFDVHHARFDQVGAILDNDSRPLSGAIFDLGVSSYQLDTPQRGFSHRHASPLDMRMDLSDPLDASTVVNSYDEDELAFILRNNSDERFARRIAKSIVASRPVESTTELAEIVRNAVPAATRRTGRHPAMRTFQAIRIAVNGELELIEPAIKQIIERLRPGGRIVVLSYHSGEDRIVKQVFREAADGVCVCPSTLPCICGSETSVKLLRRKVVRPTPEEIEANPRAASARFRAAERLSLGEA